MSVEARLHQLAMRLPGPFAPHAPLVGAIVHDGVARTSGALPRDAQGTIRAPGLLGREVSTADGADAAGLAAQNALSLLRAELGTLDAVERVLTMTVFVAATPEFDDLPAVADGASRVLVELFGDTGRHTRSAIGVARLPRGAPVEVELTVAVRAPS